MPIGRTKETKETRVHLSCPQRSLVCEENWNSVFWFYSGPLCRGSTSSQCSLSAYLLLRAVQCVLSVLCAKIQVADINMADPWHSYHSVYGPVRYPNCLPRDQWTWTLAVQRSASRCVSEHTQNTLGHQQQADWRCLRQMKLNNKSTTSQNVHTNFKQEFELFISTHHNFIIPSANFR